ncbi:LCP family protein [Candidatus Saccharibacteria bacterium]|nr:LCP family protein [Candidatus Saccharibacteria bacterium]
MENFKQNNKRKKKFSSVDGFISNTGNIDNGDIRKRFRQNYAPTSTNSFDLEIQSKTNEGLNERNPSINQDFIGYSEDKSKVSKNNFDLNLDNDIPKKPRRRFLFFKSKKDKKKQPVRKRVFKTVGVLFIVIFLSLGSILGYGYLKTRQIFKGNGEGAAGLQKNVQPSALNGEGDGRVNILLLGKGGPGHEAPDLTDTILLASIDPVQNEAALLSVPRDMYVKDALGNSMKINAIYSTAKQRKLSEANKTDSDKQLAEDYGLKAIKQSASEVLGIPVHYYVMVDFTAFKEAIDTVGGITIDVKEPLYDATMAWLNKGSPLIADKGMQTFDGNRALMYARSRHGSARGDFDRTERQREVILALEQKVLTLGTFSNPFKVVELINTLGDNVRTDLNGTGELKRLYEIMQNIGADKFVSIGLADPPNILVGTDNVNGQSIVEPLEGLYQYDKIHSYIRNTLLDPFLKQENARIVILNGTATPGLATEREKELKSYGYNIVKIDNAPTDNYAKTVLVDVTNSKPFTLSYLEKRLGLVKTTQNIEGLPTSETADFVIILGSNEVNTSTSN